MELTYNLHKEVTLVAEDISYECLKNNLHFTIELWQSSFCVGERPMKQITQISMRRLEPLDSSSCTGPRAWFVNFQ